MIDLRRKSDLGGADYGWLKAYHHFDVGLADGNRKHKPIGRLCVFNDDEIAAGRGFPTHTHKDLEIITYVREGTMVHKDSTGSSALIKAGDVQVMSAGSGIAHSETAADFAPAKVFQIWIEPRESGGAPRWDTKEFPKSDRSGAFVILASGMASDDQALQIRADARVLGATLKPGQLISYQLKPDRKAYLVTTIGQVQVNGLVLEAQDGLGVLSETEIKIDVLQDTEIILVDVAA